MSKKFSLILLSVFCVIAFSVHAQSDFPTKPIHIVVSAPPGGAADTLARLIGQKLAEAWGQPYIVDNKPGAGANLGAEFVARAPADGYTLLLAAAGFMTVNPSIYPNLPFDPIKDFAPVSLIVKAPLMLVVHPRVPAADIRELIAHAKANPGKVTVGHGGNGTAQHLGGVFFANTAGIDMLQVPYKGSAPVTNDLLGGVVDVQFDNMVTLIPHVKAGKLRALGVSSSKRVAAMPAVPTIAESGLAGFETGTWYGIVAPANTPRPVVEKLNREIVRIISVPDVQEKLLAQGLQPNPTTPAEFSSLIQADIQKYAKIVKAAGVKAE